MSQDHTSDTIDGVFMDNDSTASGKDGWRARCSATTRRIMI